jgi:hypothetical protein
MTVVLTKVGMQCAATIWGFLKVFMFYDCRAALGSDMRVTPSSCLLQQQLS